MLTERVPLSGYTTLRLGGPAARFAEARTSEDLVAAVRSIDAAGQPLLVLGGGSNLVVCDDGFPGTVLRVLTAGFSVAEPGERVLVTIAAGENWDRFVEWSIAEKLAGIECLSGIPGLAGATPIQNVGAYGQEVASTITSVTVLDRATGSVHAMASSECVFGYRTSLFKRTGWPHVGDGSSGTEGAGTAPGRVPSPTGQYVVLDVTFSLERDAMSAPIRYAELAKTLSVEIGDRAPLADVRAAVLGLRRGKGMVLDAADADTVSAGSFFTNPVLGPGELARLERVVSERSPGTRVPTFPAGSDAPEPGSVKVPAAWLIEHAGFAKGYPGRGLARISSKHTLALTNTGGATTAELIGLAREIAGGVRSEFGIELAHEPMLVGVKL
ncbi:MAG: UDP-N-acetylmuramate dehydrogenase [Nocardiopsaceae bacterium]|jgi:UDP-N-acetylmuramate dehydrogenase|nr:UDP-N-acetylmuramate dehydrogenase [Nocardiopsaceae bacterium]